MLMLFLQSAENKHCHGRRGGAYLKCGGGKFEKLHFCRSSERCVIWS